MNAARKEDVVSDGFVDSCLGDVCVAIGITDEGSRARLCTAEIEVEWEDEPPPRTARLPLVPTPYVSLSPFVHVLPSYVPTAPPTVRTRQRRGLHPAVLACAAVSLFAVAASLVVSPVGAENAVKPARALASRLALR